MANRRQPGIVRAAGLSSGSADEGEADGILSLPDVNYSTVLFQLPI